MSSEYRFDEHVTVRQTNSDLRMLFDRQRGVMYELNDTASSIVALLDGQSHSVDSLVTALGDEYDAPESALRADVEQFVSDFVGAGLLLESARAGDAS
jgi:Coenzyme PQQ synthesis protein D (PqqD)